MAKLDQRPPLIGRLEIAVWFNVGAKSADVELICGASAVTSTVSVLLPTARRGEISVTLPTCTITCSDLKAEKPFSLTLTVYVPEGSLVTRKYPDASAVIFVSAFVPLLCTNDFRICDHSTVGVINRSTNSAIGSGLCIKQRAATYDEERYCEPAVELNSKSVTSFSLSCEGLQRGGTRENLGHP